MRQRPKTGKAALFDAGWPRLIICELSNEANGTNMIYYSNRVGWYRWWPCRCGRAGSSPAMAARWRCSAVCRPSPATAKPGEARNSIMATRRLYLGNLGDGRCSDEARPRQRPWRHSGKGVPATTQSEKQLT